MDIDRPASLIARVASACTLIALSGCAVGPDYRAPPAVLPGTFDSQPALAARTAELPAPSLNSWWTGFDDPQLVRIVDAVLAQNLDVAAAIARVAQARAAAREAGARELPESQLGGSVQAQRQSLASPLGEIGSAFPGYSRNQVLRDVDAGATWELDLFGGLRRGAEAATADAEAADALRYGVRISVAAEAADAYLLVRGFQARIALTQAQVDVDERLLALVVQRQTAGVGSDLERAQAQALLAHSRAALPPLRAAMTLQCYRIDVLMAVQPGSFATGLDAGGVNFRIPAIDPGEGPAQLLRQRPDVVAAERRLAAANARIGVAVAEYYPHLSLAGLLGFESLNGHSLINAASFQPSAAAGLRWRLFDFGRVDAQVAQAQGGNAEALVRYRQTMLRATEDVENSIVQLSELEAQYQELQREADADVRSRAASQEQYTAGAVSLIEVLDADRQLLAVQDAMAQVHTDDARAAVQAFRALGGGWTTADTTH